MPGTKKKEPLLKKRAQKVLDDDDGSTTTKKAKRVLKGSSNSPSTKFFNRKQSSSSFFTSTALFDIENTAKTLATKKKDSRSKTPNYNCSIIKPEKKTAKKLQTKIKPEGKSKITAKKNGTTVEKEASKATKRIKKEKSTPSAKKPKKQKNESIVWDPAWDRDTDEKSRDSNCSCSACQTPSDCSCSHCEESRQNGTKKNKTYTKKKEKSHNSCNTAEFECPYNTSDFDSDFDPSSIAKSKSTTKKSKGKKTGSSSKKESSGTTFTVGKYVKKKSDFNIEEAGVDIKIEKLANFESSNSTDIKLNGEGLKTAVESNLKKEKKKKVIKNKNLDKENNSQIIAYSHKKQGTEYADGLFDDNEDCYMPEHCDFGLIDEDVYSDDFDDYSDCELDTDDYSDSEEDSDDYSDNAEDSENYSYSDFDEEEFEDDSYDSDYQLPDDVNDDLYIASGTAVKYELNKPDVSFDSDCNEAQIIEISKDEKNNLNATEKNNLTASFVQSNSENESNDSCPQLVPISYEALNPICESDLDEEEYTSDCYSMESTTDLSAVDMDENKVESTSMEPTIFTTDDISDYIMPDFLELEQSALEEDENPINSLMSKTKISKDCEVVMPQIENQSKQNKYELGCEIENFQTEFFNSIDSLQVLLLLKDPIFIYGTLKLELIAGSCEIFGYKPKLEERVEIFSPRGYSFLNIQALKNENGTKTKDEISKKINKRFSKEFMKSDLNEILKKYDEKIHAICLLERNDRSKKFDMIKKYMKQNLIPNMNSITLERPFYTSEFILRCIIRTKTDNAMIIDSNWETINIENSTKLMVIGGKSIGKSTLLRYIINKNLSKFGKMVFIDLDIGQPELFIPQTISVTVLDRPLLGPGYFLNLQPKKTLLFGDINVVVNPLRYLEIIKELLEYCYQEKEFQNIPWVVNTMGYNKGIGSEIIVLITKYLSPTDIIQLQSSKEINNYDHIMHPDMLHKIPMNIFNRANESFTANHRLILFNSIINNKKKSNEWDMKPKDMRFAILITRLGAILNERYDWLTDCKPISTSIDDVNIVSFGDDKLSKKDLLEVINANLVYLCKQSKFKTSLECFGIGLVRGIDNFQQKIYLLPSIYNNLLENVNCLAICNIPLPTSVYLNQGPKIKGVTPYAFNTNENVSSKYVSQIYYRPKQFLNAGIKNYDE